MVTNILQNILFCVLFFWMNLTIHLTQQSRADMTVEVHLLTNMVTHTTTSLNNGGLKFVGKKKQLLLT